ncbi:isochorismate synthase [Saonia flava]|uniref:Isochorismate synthase n=1 Tax=Saonia flava TaxID=523696 RepID=A0A846QVP9_9FLAO|nr:chorismate-binding protein [Saonia flava]NJB69645.1 isochorismate synthase [Saonia flava]
MFSQFLEKVDGQYSLKLPFVVYRKPNQTKVKAIFQENDQLHRFTEFTKNGFIFGAFDDEHPIRIKIDRIEEVEYNPKMEVAIDKYPFATGDKHQKEFHIDLVTRAINEIKQGSFEKVVVSRKIEVPCDTAPLSLFLLLLKRYKNTFCYIWYHPKVGLWIGATPETLLTANGKKFSTMSLAGTLEYKANLEPVWGEKELNEQELVTQYISDNLRDNLKGMTVSKPESVRAGNLWHLRSNISGEITIGLKETVEALHPTPAVCGLPKSNSKAFILTHENYDREYYTGFLGEVNFGEDSNESHLFVNLRCLKLVKSMAFIYVGGGITKASIPEKEWKETNIKAETMLNIINFFK